MSHEGKPKVTVTRLPDSTVNLEMDEYSAYVVMRIMACVGGHPFGPRSVADIVYEALFAMSGPGEGPHIKTAGSTYIS